MLSHTVSVGQEFWSSLGRQFQDRISREAAVECHWAYSHWKRACLSLDVLLRWPIHTTGKLALLLARGHSSIHEILNRNVLTMWVIQKTKQTPLDLFLSLLTNFKSHTRSIIFYWSQMSAPIQYRKGLFWVYWLGGKGLCWREKGRVKQKQNREKKNISKARENTKVRWNFAEQG